MNKSESISELVTALAAAQQKFEKVKKDSDNPAYRGSKYADMHSVIAATRQHLVDNGLVVIQTLVTDVENQRAGCSTMLAHKSGQFIEETYLLPALMQGNKFDAQSCGSAFTYARRYSWQAMVGVAPEDDDDGNAASGVGSNQAAQAVATSKLRSKDGNEILVITPYMQGFVALSGTGLSIVRANMDNAMRAKYGWVEKGNVFMIPVEKVSALKEFCTFHQVSVQDEVPAVAVQPEQKPKTNGHAPATPFSDDPATDPIIMEAKHIPVKPGKKEFLVVKWDGHELSLFDKKLFAPIQAHVGKPAMFDWSGNGKYKNIIHVVRLGGMDFLGSTDMPYQATDADLPY